MNARRPVTENPEDTLGRKPDPLVELGNHPLPEDQFGGGDICSPEEETPIDDDNPLD